MAGIRGSQPFVPHSKTTIPGCHQREGGHFESSTGATGRDACHTVNHVWATVRQPSLVVINRRAAMFDSSTGVTSRDACPTVNHTWRSGLLDQPVSDKGLGISLLFS